MKHRQPTWSAGTGDQPMKSFGRLCAAFLAVTTIGIGTGATLAAAEETPAGPAGTTPTTEAPAPPAPEPLQTQAADDVGAQANSTFTVALDTVPNALQDFNYSESTTATSFKLDNDQGVAGAT